MQIQPAAPPKPALGQACNGCGLCCLYAPCPIGMLVSRKLKGACRALRWHEAQSRYRCGLLGESENPAGAKSSGRFGRWRQALLRRWIAAGVGCDADLAIVATPPSAP